MMRAAVRQIEANRDDRGSPSVYVLHTVASTIPPPASPVEQRNDALRAALAQSTPRARPTSTSRTSGQAAVDPPVIAGRARGLSAGRSPVTDGSWCPSPASTGTSGSSSVRCSDPAARRHVSGVHQRPRHPHGQPPSPTGQEHRLPRPTAMCPSPSAVPGIRAGTGSAASPDPRTSRRRSRTWRTSRCRRSTTARRCSRVHGSRAGTVADWVLVRHGHCRPLRPSPPAGATAAGRGSVGVATTASRGVIGEPLALRPVWHAGEQELYDHSSTRSQFATSWRSRRQTGPWSSRAALRAARRAIRR